MKASVLINDAYRFGNIIAEEGQTLTATQLSDGARLLNYIIDDINKNGNEISLNAQEVFTLPSGQQTFTLNDYIKINKMQFNISTIWIDVELLSTEDFYNFAVIDNVKSLPFSGYAKRTATGIEMFFYFIPDRDFPVRIVSGLKKIVNLQPDDDLSDESLFYKTLLVWTLANDLRVRNQMGRDPEISKKINEIKNRLKDIKPINHNINTVKIGITGESASQKSMRLSAEGSLLRGYRP
jgi:hypothetical protein